MLGYAVTSPRIRRQLTPLAQAAVPGHVSCRAGGPECRGDTPSKTCLSAKRYLPRTLNPASAPSLTERRRGQTAPSSNPTALSASGIARTGSASREVNPMAERFRPKTIQTGLPRFDASRVRPLDVSAGATPRLRGPAWMKLRYQALVRGGYECVDCGRISQSNEIDHDIPLSKGGTDAPDNLRVRCIPCHAAKSADEAKRRW